MTIRINGHGTEELADMTHANAHCHFFNEHYHVNEEDLAGLLEVATS